MEITEKTDGGVLILTVSGEIDLNQSPTLRSTLRAKAAAKTPCLLLDFSAVLYIDSSGLATLIEYYQSSRTFAGKLALCSLAPRVRSSFDLVRLSEVFSIYPDLAAARKALTPGSS
ncbi:MAG: anti-sigma factor antagonist [Verrucomicrobia bacterium]|nr:anti-sigma factor antagonist [Verrucomicrobiota bacterium]